jgi:hypothetical protein
VPGTLNRTQTLEVVPVKRSSSLVAVHTLKAGLP